MLTIFDSMHLHISFAWPTYARVDKCTRKMEKSINWTHVFFDLQKGNGFSGNSLCRTSVAEISDYEYLYFHFILILFQIWYLAIDKSYKFEHNYYRYLDKVLLKVCMPTLSIYFYHIKLHYIHRGLNSERELLASVIELLALWIQYHACYEKEVS